MRLFNLLALILVFQVLNSCGSELDIPDNPDDDQTTQRGAFIDDWTYSIFPKEDDNFAIAQFRLWLPEESQTPRALLILLDHYNGNGLYLSEDENWRSFARSENLGIVSVYFYSNQEHAGYYLANLGSGNALQEAILEISKRQNVNHITSASYLMRGYSGGGAFCFSFSAYYPELVGAIADVRGGGMKLEMARNEYVPGLLLNGGLESADLQAYSREIVEGYRAAGGNWAHAIEPGQTHYGDLKPSDDLVRALFSAVLKKRIDPSTNKIVNLPENSGLLGNNTTKVFFPFSNYPEDKAKTSWLIDSTFAPLWSNFQN